MYSSNSSVPVEPVAKRRGITNTRENSTGSLACVTLLNLYARLAEINEGLHAKSAYIEFWPIFLQDRANFWQTDLF